MNNPSTFKLGWAAFTVCFLTGAGIGYKQALDGREERVKNLVKQTADRDAALEKLEKKMRDDGSKVFKSKKISKGESAPTATVASPPAPPPS